MVTRHTYASIDSLRDYLAGTSYSSNWTSDTAIIRRIVESASKRIDNYVGMQSFGPRTETRFFDIGSGTLRSTRQNIVPSYSDETIGNSSGYVNSIPLDAWLIETTTVTSYKSTDRSTSETLSEGYNADFWLKPYNSSPKVELTLNEDTTKSFYGGQQTLSVLGTWGYSNDTTPEKTTTGTIATETETAWGVNDASGLSSAQTILVGAEQMYITGISSNTLTVIRGVNGTTASTHSAGASVYVYEYPELVSQICLDIAKVFFRDRDLGVIQTIGGGDIPITRSDKEIENNLMQLREYKAQSIGSGVFF